MSCRYFQPPPKKIKVTGFTGEEINKLRELFPGIKIKNKAIATENIKYKEIFDNAKIGLLDNREALDILSKIEGISIELIEQVRYNGLSVNFDMTIKPHCLQFTEEINQVIDNISDEFGDNISGQFSADSLNNKDIILPRFLFIKMLFGDNPSEELLSYFTVKNSPNFIKLYLFESEMSQIVVLTDYVHFMLDEELETLERLLNHKWSEGTDS